MDAAPPLLTILSSLVPTRTSGTEPKVMLYSLNRILPYPNGATQIKYYLEGQGKDATSLTTLLGNVVHTLQEDWLEATKNKLLCPV